MNNTPIEKLWKTFSEFLSEFDIQEKFIKSTKKKLEQFYKPLDKQKKLFEFFKDEDFKPQFDDVISASIFMIFLGIDLSNTNLEVSNKDDKIKEAFFISARFLELIIKYESEDITINQKINLLLLSALSYDLSDKIANGVVQIKKVAIIREAHEFPFDLINQLEFFLVDALSFLLSRKLKYCMEVCEQALTLNNYFDELLESQSEKSSSYKKIVSHRFLAYIQFITSIKELVNFLIYGNKESYELAHYYLEKSKRNFLLSFEEFNFLITEMLNVFLIRVKERILFNYLDEKNEISLKYIKILQKDDIYEFWPSQIECIKNDIFSSSNFLICAPTSAGKSLMAELAIVHEFAKNRMSHCFYVVPSKALANQVTKSLEKHLDPLGIKIFKIVGGQNENFEDLFLKNIKICVMTPEKFYQYEKKSHKFFLNSNLIIFDEAHLIGSGFRGLSLEFEIAKLLRKHPKKRIILISAVIRNFDKISNWISKDEKFLFSDWKPTTTINAFLDLNNQLIFFDELTGLKIPVPSIKKNDSILKKVATLTYIYHKKLGMTLVFSNTKPNAEKIAKTIYENFKLEDIRNSKAKMKIDLLISIISKVIGENYPLIKYLKKGLTFHHASLPDEIRERIEELIQDGTIKIIVATTTLAEGVNTPISCLLVPYTNFYDHIKKKNTPITKRLFKNIVGRVGRALINTEGYVIMFESDSLNSEKIKDYLFIDTDEIENLNSYLIELTELDLKKSFFSLGDFNYKQNYPLALLQRDLLSVLMDNVYTGDSIEKIMKQTLFNNQIKIQDKVYNKAKELINNSIKTMENLPIPAVTHSSPYRLTAFGKLCYNTGLSPVTMNRFLLEIKKITKEHPHVLKFNDLKSKSDERLLKDWFSILPQALEVKNDSLEQLPTKLEDIPDIIFNWIKGMPLSNIRANYFGDDDKALRDTVDFIQGFIVYYGPWLLSAMNEILKYLYKGLEIPMFLKSLPNYLMTGTTEWNEMVLISLEICRRNEGSKELGDYFREINLRDEDLLLENFMKKLGSIDKLNILKILENFHKSYASQVWGNIEKLQDLSN